MLEVRAVSTEELDAMLSVMCEAFMLPLAPARSLFYKDPYFDIEKKRVLVKDGQVVSCLTIVEMPMWIGQAAVRVAGIAGVGTRPAHRRQGYAGRLLRETLGLLAQQGYGLSALFPYSYVYYRRFGWECAGTQYRLVLSPTWLPRFADARYVRAALPSDLPDMQRLYDAYSRHKTGRCLRDAKRWAYLYEHAKSKAVYKRSGVEGYALYERREGGEGQTNLRLLEVVATTEAARRGLAGFLAEQEDISEIEHVAAWDDLRDSGLLPLGGADTEGSALRVEAQPGPMFRVVDLCHALEGLRANWTGFKGEVTLVMLDDPSPSSGRLVVTLEGDGDALEIRPDTGSAHPRRRIEGEARAWAPVLVGHHSLRDALALNHLRAYSEAAASLAAPLFPRRDPFIPIPDYP